MKRATLCRSVLNRSLFLLLAAIVIAGCGDDDNPLKDDSGTINPSSDRQRVIENLSIDDAMFRTDALPANSSDEDAPVLSLNSIDVVGIKSPGGGTYGQVDPEQEVQALLSAPAGGGNQSKHAIQTEDDDHAIVRIRSGQTINTVIFFTPFGFGIHDPKVNVSIQGATGYYTVGEEAFPSDSRCELKIKTSKEFRPGTFQIIINITDSDGIEDITSQNNIVIDVVVTGEPSDDANRLIFGNWIVKYQAPLPPYFPQDYRGQRIVFRDNKTISVFGTDGTEIQKGNYEIRTIGGITGIYPSNVLTWSPLTQEWIPTEPAEYKVEGLNLTTLILTEIEGLGRALIFEKQ